MAFWDQILTFEPTDQFTCPTKENTMTSSSTSSTHQLTISIPSKKHVTFAIPTTPSSNTSNKSLFTWATSAVQYVDSWIRCNTILLEPSDGDYTSTPQPSPR